jgi:hypothetical protein
MLNAEGRRRKNAEFQDGYLTLGGEIGSCLAYTQKSEGQNLPERPVFAKASTRRASLRRGFEIGVKALNG